MTVEEQIAELRNQVADLRERLSHLEQEWQGIPDLIEARLKLTDSRVAALSADMNGVKRTLGDLRGEVQALPARSGRHAGRARAVDGPRPPRAHPRSG